MIKYCKLFGKVRCRETNEKGVKSVCMCVMYNFIVQGVITI